MAIQIETETLSKIEAAPTNLNLEALTEFAPIQPDPFTFYASSKVANIGIQHSPEWKKGKFQLLSAHEKLRALEQKLKQEIDGYVMVVGGGATATAAINELSRLKNNANQPRNIAIIHIFDPKDLAGQTKKIDWNIHRPEANQKNAVIAATGPVFSIGQKLNEEKIGEIAKLLKVDYIIDARGLTPEDETKLVDKENIQLQYGLENNLLVSREFIDLVHTAENELAQGKPEFMISLLKKLDLGHVVISGAGKVGTQDLVAKVRLLQVAQLVYRKTKRLLDFQKFASKEKNSFSVNLAKIGLRTEDLGDLTVVNRSLPRIIDPTKEHIMDVYGKEVPFPDVELIRNKSAKFRANTYAELKNWQDEFGFNFIEGVTPNQFDSKTQLISYVNQAEGSTNRATLVLSALGVKKYPYPESWKESADGKVAGMRATGSGNISDSAMHVKRIIEEYLDSIAIKPKKSPAQNQELYQAFNSLLLKYPEGDPITAMIEHSPWLLIKDWLKDPIKSINLNDFILEMKNKVNQELTWEAHQLLVHVSSKINASGLDNHLISTLSKIKKEDLILRSDSETSQSYLEFVVSNLDLPFRLRLDEQNKLWFTAKDNSNTVKWQQINNLAQLDHLIRTKLNIKDTDKTSYSDKEDQLLFRYKTTKDIVINDLFTRFLYLKLRTKFNYSNEELKSIDIHRLLTQLSITDKGIKLDNYSSPLTQSEFDVAIDNWHNSQKITEVMNKTVTKLMKYKSEALAAVGGILTSAAVSLLNFDPKTLVELTSIGLGVSTLAAAAVSNAREVFPQHKEKLDKTARVIELLGIGMLGAAGWSIGSAILSPADST